jgi:hypothetical protein
MPDKTGVICMDPGSLPVVRITAQGQSVHADRTPLVAAQSSAVHGLLRDLQQEYGSLRSIDLPFPRRTVEAWLAGLAGTRMGWRDQGCAIEVCHLTYVVRCQYFKAKR